MTLEIHLPSDAKMTRPDVPEAARLRPPTADQCVKETYNLPADWEHVSWETKGDGAGEFMVIEGAVYSELFTRGPRKGRKNFRRPKDGTSATVSITRAALAAWMLNWETETGLCNDCWGTGWAYRGWSAQHGTYYCPCKRCGETGKAPDLIAVNQAALERAETA